MVSKGVVAWAVWSALAVALLAGAARPCDAKPEPVPRSPSELEDRIVSQFPQASACVLLLHNHGHSGCAGVVGDALVRPFAAGAEVTGSEVLLVEERDLGREALDAVRGSRGALVLRSTEGDGEREAEERPDAFSPASAFPESNFAPYADRSYAWNPAGLDVLRTAKPLPPMYLLSADESRLVRERVLENGEDGGRLVADLNSEMHAAKDANSFECLKSETCLPLGGYSVFSRLPPAPQAVHHAESSSSQGECVLVLAQVDKGNLFHRMNKGAEGALSGLIASAAAFEAVAKAIAAAKEPVARSLVFGFVGSEGYGLAGSRRVVSELAAGRAVSGCALADVSFIVEVGSVGLPRSMSEEEGGLREYFLHMTPQAQNSSDGAAIYEAFEAAAKSSGQEAEVVVRRPSGTPGIPPSSLMSFQHAEGTNALKASIPGMVLTDFNETLANKYLSSYLDDAGNVNVSSVSAASELLAKALYRIAYNVSSEEPPAPVDTESLNATVYDLTGCLLTSSEGMQCDLVQQVADSYLGSVSLYPGVLFGLSKDLQNPNDKTDFVRFLWSFLATRAGGLSEQEISDQAATCDFPSGKLKCAGEGDVCARWRSKTKGKGDSGSSKNGRCVSAQMQYVPAWSQHLLHDPKTNAWRINGTASTVADDIWTESNWNYGTPSAMIRVTETHAYGVVLFLSGLILTGACFWGVKRARQHIEKQMKQW